MHTSGRFSTTQKYKTRLQVAYCLRGDFTDKIKNQTYFYITLTFLFNILRCFCLFGHF